MTDVIKPQNLAAQLGYRGRGNPPNSHPVSAISNCFPGLEFDFRAVWRRMLTGLVLSENNNIVVQSTISSEMGTATKVSIPNLVAEAEDPSLDYLKGHRLLYIGPPRAALPANEKHPISVPTSGIANPQLGTQPLGTQDNPNGVSFMEWSNSFARIMAWQGHKVTCYFTPEPSDTEVLPGSIEHPMIVEIELRHFFQQAVVDRKTVQLPVINSDLVRPGELSQGLCSPWQNDYRECACYYWAASRPDYVNIEDTATGESRGDNWMSIERTGDYILDDRSDPRLLSYDDLFEDWQRKLRFQIDGRDSIGIDKDGKGIPDTRKL
ncbi:MAG: hypothetical protein WCC64_05435 [Aliidongia sp.]